MINNKKQSSPSCYPVKKIFLLGFVTFIIVACGAPEKKHYDDLAPIKPRLDVSPEWVAPTGGVSKEHHKQLPVIPVGKNVYVANSKGEVGMLHMDSGEVNWVKSLNVPIIAGPGYGNKLLVVTTDEAEIIALEAKSGDVRWRKHLNTISVAAPVIDDDRVFIQTIDAKLEALNAKTGERIWVAEQEMPALTLRGTSRPVILKDNVIAGFANGKLVAMNKLTGKIQWETVIAVPNGRTDLERMVDIDGMIGVNDETIYVATYQGRVSAIGASDGHVIWTRDMSSYTGVLFAFDQLYLTDADGLVWSLDLNTGATLWRQDKLKGRDTGTPVAMKDAIVIADGSGLVHWLSKDDGGLIARGDLEYIYKATYVHWIEEEKAPLDHAITAMPRVENNRLFVRDNAGTLTVFQVNPPQNNPS